MASAPIILVPGFWLGAWAWDEVAELLRANGHDVTALTLPGLESPAADRSKITVEDHVQAMVAAVKAAPRPPILAVHSGTGGPGYAVSDRVPELLAAMVYVDSFPLEEVMDPDFSGAELPLPSFDELTQDPGNSLEGVSEVKLEEFRRRAVPEPGALFREAPVFENEARLDVPTVVICTGTASQDFKDAVAAGQSWIAPLGQLRNVRYIDLPTSHWVMWSKPRELAQLLSDIANEYATP